MRCVSYRLANERALKIFPTLATIRLMPYHTVFTSRPRFVLNAVGCSLVIISWFECGVHSKIQREAFASMIDHGQRDSRRVVITRSRTRRVTRANSPLFQITRRLRRADSGRETHDHAPQCRPSRNKADPRLSVKTSRYFAVLTYISLVGARGGTLGCSAST